MDSERKLAIDNIVEPLTVEFKENASHGDGNFGVFYMSADAAANDFKVSLEANRETFKRMILSLMEMDRLVAEDIQEAVNSYVGPDPLNLRYLAG